MDFRFSEKDRGGFFDLFFHRLNSKLNAGFIELISLYQPLEVLRPQIKFIFHFFHKIYTENSRDGKFVNRDPFVCIYFCSYDISPVKGKYAAEKGKKPFFIKSEHFHL